MNTGQEWNEQPTSDTGLGRSCQLLQKQILLLMKKRDQLLFKQMRIDDLTAELKSWREQATILGYILALRAGGTAYISDVTLTAIRPCDIQLEVFDDAENRRRVIRIVKPTKETP